MKKHCMVSGCSHAVAEKQFMCVPHWEMVDDERKAEIRKLKKAPCGPLYNTVVKLAVDNVNAKLADEREFESWKGMMGY